MLQIDTHRVLVIVGILSLTLAIGGMIFNHSIQTDTLNDGVRMW
jgi:hypothetical protein